MTDILLVFSTFPDADSARHTGTLLIESQLAACVNLLPQIQSIYRWQGKIETSDEVLAIFKTTQATYSVFEQKLLELHPYDVPEILAFPIEKASAAYAQWIMAETLPKMYPAQQR